MRALRKAHGVMKLGLKNYIAVKMKDVESMADEQLTKRKYNANVDRCRYRQMGRDQG